MPHSITVPFATTHIILESLNNLEHALNMLHAERSLLRQRDGLARLDGVLDLKGPVNKRPIFTYTVMLTCRPFMFRLLNSLKSDSVNGLTFCFPLPASLSPIAIFSTLPTWCCQIAFLAAGLRFS